MIHIVAKNEPSKFKENMLRLSAVGLSLVASGIVIACMGHNPFVVFWNIITGSIGKEYYFQQTVHKAIPLAMLSLGIAMSFRMKFWNIGADGQFYMGAFGAAFIAFKCPNLPIGVMLPLMLIASVICGGIWATVASLLKNKIGASETLVTLMLNYIATKWITYLQFGPWKRPDGFPRMPRFPDAAILPKLGGIHIGWIITLICMLLLYVLFRRTKLGYEIDVIGESSTTARYAGINVQKVTFIAVFLSGALCGVAGMMQASAMEKSLTYSLSGGMGFTAVITTYLGQLNPILITVVSFLFSMLIQGGSGLQASMGIPSTMTQVIQGIIIFFVLGSEFFLKYKFVRTAKTETAKSPKGAEK